MVQLFGRTSVRLGRGKYEIMGPSGLRFRETIRVDGTGKVVRDFGPATERAEVAGVVVDPEGRPMPGAAIRVVGPGDTTRAKADAAGRFAFRRSAGWNLLCAKTDDDALAGLTVLKDGPAEVRLALGRSATVAGRVVDGEGKGVEGGQISLTLVTGPGDEPARTSPLAFATTDRDGRYHLPAMVPGARYEARVVVLSGPRAGERFTLKTFGIDGPDRPGRVHRRREALATRRSQRRRRCRGPVGGVARNTASPRTGDRQ